MRLSGVFALACAAVALFSASTSVFAVDPGVVVSVNDVALNQFANRVIPLVLDTVTTMTFPEVTGTESGFDYGLNNTRVTAASIDSINVGLKDRATLLISGAHFELAMDWAYRLHAFPHLPYGSGAATASLTASKLTVDISIGTHQTPKGLAPQFRVSSVVVDIDRIDIHTSESVFSWLYNIIARAFRGKIKSMVADRLSAAIKQTVDVASDAVIETLLLRVPIGVAAVADLSLTAAPIVTAAHVMAVPFNGEVYPVSTGKSDGATKRVPHVPKPPQDRMLSASVSSFVIQSLLHVEQTSGAFAAIFDAAHRPALWPVDFNTDAWTLLPALAAHYPHAPLRLAVGLGEPVVTISAKDEVTVSAQLLTDLDVQPAAGGANAWKRAFTIEGDLELHAKVVFDDTDPRDPLLVLSFSHVATHITTRDSSIGPVDVAAIDTLVATLVKETIVPWVNTVFASGIPLPSLAGVRLVNTRLRFANGAVALETDMEYVPPQGLLDTVLARVLPGALPTPSAPVPAPLRRLRIVRRDGDADGDC